VQRPIDFLSSYVERQLARSKGRDRSQDLLMFQVKEDFVESLLDCISALEHEDARRVTASAVQKRILRVEEQNHPLAVCD